MIMIPMWSLLIWLALHVLIDFGQLSNPWCSLWPREMLQQDVLPTCREPTKRCDHLGLPQGVLILLKPNRLSFKLRVGFNRFIAVLKSTQQKGRHLIFLLLFKSDWAWKLSDFPYEKSRDIRKQLTGSGWTHDDLGAKLFCFCLCIIVQASDEFWFKMYRLYWASTPAKQMTCKLIVFGLDPSCPPPHTELDSGSDLFCQNFLDDILSSFIWHIASLSQDLGCYTQTAVCPLSRWLPIHRSTPHPAAFQPPACHQLPKHRWPETEPWSCAWARPCSCAWSVPCRGWGAGGRVGSIFLQGACTKLSGKKM